MIREAIASDVPRIRSRMQGIPDFWQPWWSDDTIETALRSTGALAFVWEGDDAEILGFVCAHDLGFRAYLGELAVAKHVRHRGVGTRLVRTVEEALRKKNQRVVIADVWQDAEPFYRSLGWEPPKVVFLRQRLDPQD